MKKYKFKIDTITNVLNAMISHYSLTGTEDFDSLIEKMKVEEEDKELACDILMGKPILNGTLHNNIVRASLFLSYPNNLSLTFPVATEIENSAFCNVLGSLNVTAENVTKIGSNAFFSTKLSLAHFSKVTEIGDWAFARCTSLTSIYLPEVVSIGSSAFYSCSRLTSIGSCEHVTKLMPSTFAMCSNLVTADLPNVSVVNRYAFQSCINLTTFNASNIAGVGSMAFAFCSSLLSIDLNKCQVIQSSAFYYCSSIKEVSMTMISNIGGNAFYGCNSLESVYILTSTLPAISRTTFASTPLSVSSYLGYFGSIYVYRSMLEAFIYTGSWSYYKDRIVAYD